MKGDLHPINTENRSFVRRASAPSLPVRSFLVYMRMPASNDFVRAEKATTGEELDRSDV